MTSQPHNCAYCHKQYATNAKLLQHQRKEHLILPNGAAAVAVNPSTQPKKRQSESINQGLLVTLSSQDIANADETWRPGPSAAEPSTPIVPQPPPNLEYRIDGEVLQLTRVPQAEAMRLVNSGATVIHVADGQEPGPSHRLNPSAMTAENHRHATSYEANRASLNANYDLPVELVQVIVNQQQQQQTNNTESSSSSTTQNNPNHSSNNGSRQPNQQDASNNWINAYRRQQP